MDFRTGLRGRAAPLAALACTLLLLVVPAASAGASPTGGFGTAHSADTYGGRTCYFEAPFAIAIDPGRGIVRVAWALVQQDSSRVSDPSCPAEGDQVGGQGFSTPPGETATCTSGAGGAISCSYSGHGISLTWSIGASPAGATDSSLHIVFDDHSDGSHSDLRATLTRF